MFICFREGRSNAHIKGDYQRIGDVMLKNFQGLKVSHRFTSHSCIFVITVMNWCSFVWLNFVRSPWRQTCISSPTCCWSWRRRAGHPAGWRVSAGTLSCRRCATSPWMSSSCALCTASSTTSRSWSVCANTTQLLMWISGTAEVLCPSRCLQRRI